MYVGILTSPFNNTTLDDVIDFAATNGFGGLEIHVSHGGGLLDPHTVKKPSEIAKKCAERSVEISSLAYYCNVLAADQKNARVHIEMLKKTIDIASKMGVSTVCTLAGLAPECMSREQCIEELVPKVWTPIVKYAATRKVRIAFENWFATLLLNLDCFQRLFSVLPHEHVGLNFDPSHLHWMDIDYYYGVEHFADRIFHVHAKDTEINHHKKQWVGNQGGCGWWRYVIPGRGEIDWGRFIGCLRKNGYNGTLSIEHEDGSVGREEGFRIALKHLSQFIDS